MRRCLDHRRGPLGVHLDRYADGACVERILSDECSASWVLERIPEVDTVSWIRELTALIKEKYAESMMKYAPSNGASSIQLGIFLDSA